MRGNGNTIVATRIYDYILLFITCMLFFTPNIKSQIILNNDTVVCSMQTFTLNAISSDVDSLIVIPNDLLQSLGERITVFNAFDAANDVLLNKPIQNTHLLVIVPWQISLSFIPLFLFSPIQVMKSPKCSYIVQVFRDKTDSHYMEYCMGF